MKVLRFIKEKIRFCIALVMRCFERRIPEVRMSKMHCHINGYFYLIEIKTIFGWKQPKDSSGLSCGIHYDKKQAMQWLRYYRDGTKSKVVVQNFA